MSTIGIQRLDDLSRRQIVNSLYQNWFSYLLVVPIVLYLITLVWYPAVQGLVMSFYRWPLFGQKEFIGLDNYVYLLTWDTFYTSLKATFIYGTQTIGHLVLGTTMALIVWNQTRWKGLTSVLFLVPYIIPPIVSGTLFRYILHPDVGPFFKVLVDLGVLNSPIYWMTNGTMALIGITLIGIWTWSSLVFLLVYASLTSIPESYYETAQIYGASTWEKFRYITFPQIKSTLLIALILRVVYNLGKVTQPLQITRGGPGNATSVLGILLYRLAWQRQDFGLAFSVGVILGVIALSIVGWFIWKFEQEEEVAAA